VAVVDDEEGSRTSMGWVLSDAELRAVPIVGPLQDLEDAFRKVTAESHGMVCDHHLNVRNYARFSGARLVSFATRNQFPAILCTRYNGSDIDVIRPLLPDIPVVLRPDEINEPDEVHRAFRDCKAELDGKVSPERKAWRAQIVIERIDDERKVVDLAVPAWTLEESIRLRFEDIPAAVRPQIAVGFRTHAYVNLGAESPDALFVKWSRRG